MSQLSEVQEKRLCRRKMNNLKRFTTKMTQCCHCLVAQCYYTVVMGSNNNEKGYKRQKNKEINAHTLLCGRFCACTVLFRHLLRRARSPVPRCHHHHPSHFYLLQRLRTAGPLDTVTQKNTFNTKTYSTPRKKKKITMNTLLLFYVRYFILPPLYIYLITLVTSYFVALDSSVFKGY